MSRKVCSILSTVILLIGLGLMALIKRVPFLDERVLCSIVLFILVLLRLIGYRTNYTKEEIAQDRITMIFLCVAFLFVLGSTLLPFFRG